MTIQTRIDSLLLTNYRKFAELEISFDPRLTVLVADNGGGKTAILDAVAIAFRHFVDFLQSKQSHGFDKSSDVRLARQNGSMAYIFPTMLQASATVGGRRVEWRRELTSADSKTTHSEAHVGELTHQARQLLMDLNGYLAGRSETPPLLPAVAYYGTGRLWGRHKKTEGKKSSAGNLALQLGAYLDCLSPSSRFEHFAVWFERIVREAQNERETVIESPHRPQTLLFAVRSAVDAVLKPSGWQHLDFDFLTEEVVATHPEQGRLPVDFLSDGARGLVALAADLAHRAARLNPHLGHDACKKTPGIVLVDEVDLSLHPSWQQTVIDSLLRAFPAMQFIVTTHSPLVISTVPSASIRILGEHDEVVTPELETEGYDGRFALSTVFHVDSRPPGSISDELAHYRHLLELGQGNSCEAERLGKKLIEHFGSKHPAILETATIRRLQEFKAKANANRGKA